MKQIQVMSFSSVDFHNRAYMRLVSVANKPTIRTRIDLDTFTKKGAINRKELMIKAGDDLYELSGKRDLYEGYIVEEINVGEGYVSFTNNERPLRLDMVQRDVDDMAIKEAQMKATIEEHLHNQSRLKPKEIKG